MMANLKSAIKRARTNKIKRDRNQSIRTNMRSMINQVNTFIEAEDVENAQTAFNEATSVIDKTVQKGAIHRNNGNRQKARLARKIQALKAE